MAVSDNLLATERPTAVVLYLAGAVLMAIAWAVVDWVWLRPKKLEKILRKQGLSGNPYRLYYGDLRDSSMMIRQAKSKPMSTFSNHFIARVRPFQHKTIKNYGKNCFYWDGPVPLVNISEPELIREVMNRYTEFQKPKANPITRMLLRGLVSYEGEKWAAHRKLLNPAFHMEKLKLMLPSFRTSCVVMVNKWEKVLPEPDSQQEIDVWPYLTSLTADAISRAAFGSSFEEGRTIFQLIREQIALTVYISQTVYFPGRRFLPTKDNMKMRGLSREIRALIAGIIDKRKEEINKPCRDDLLGLMLQASTANAYNTSNTTQYNNLAKQYATPNKRNAITMTISELVEECKVFYLAGQETTSTLLVWTLILLSKHQDWQSQAREEVLATFGQDKDPNFEGLNHLKIMNMILHEVLRLYPPVVELRRTVMKDDTKLGKLTLPSGILVSVPIALVHHDRDQWGDDASEFNPARFSQGISKASNHGAAFLPFGGGPRICLGANFSLTEAKIVLSMILQRYSFQISPTYSHAPSAAGILHPQFGAPLLLRRRF